MASLRKWIRTKLIDPAKLLSPSQIGLSVAGGVWGGIFPVPGISSFATLFLCSTVLGRMFNPAMLTIALSINIAVTPIQLMAMPSFMNVPSLFVEAPTCNVGDLLTSLKTRSLMETGASFGKCLAWGVATWTLMAPIFIISTRTLIATALRTFMKKRNT